MLLEARRTCLLVQEKEAQVKENQDKLENFRTLMRMKNEFRVKSPQSESILPV